MTERYPVEVLDDMSDDGTMPGNVEYLAASVVGHKIVSVEENATIPKVSGESYYWRYGPGFKITLDNGRAVYLSNTNDCCAYTELESFLLHADKIDHVITGVGTTDGYETWHIYADLGDVLELNVGWSSGNPFYYGYGFSIIVVEDGQ